MGVACVLAFASAPTAPLFLGPLGWTPIGKLRDLGAAGVGQSGRRRAGARAKPIAAASWPNHVIRDARYLQWRYLDSPRGYEVFASDDGYAVVWPAKRHQGTDDLRRRRSRRVRPELLREARRRAQARVQFALPAPEQRAAYVAQASCPRRRR